MQPPAPPRLAYHQRSTLSKPVPYVVAKVPAASALRAKPPPGYSGYSTAGRLPVCSAHALMLNTGVALLPPLARFSIISFRSAMERFDGAPALSPSVSSAYKLASSVGTAGKAV